jgi:hypothetical protein
MINLQSPMPPGPPREEALFRAAAELPPGTARRAFLDQACAGDPALPTNTPPHVHSVLNERGGTADTLYQGTMAECPYCQQIKTHITAEAEIETVLNIPTEAERQRIWDNNGELPTTEPSETALKREYRELAETYEQQLRAIKDKYNSPAHKLKLQRESEYLKTITEKPKRCSLIVSIYIWLVKLLSPSR